ILSMTSRSTNAVDLSGSSVTTSEVRPTLSVPPVTGALLPPELLAPPQPATMRSAQIKPSHSGSVLRSLARPRLDEEKLETWETARDDGKEDAMREPPMPSGYSGTRQLCAR